MRRIPCTHVVYSFSRSHPPAGKVKIGEIIELATDDAFGGQIKTERDSVRSLDWSRVDGTTGPLYIQDVRRGDTLVVEILQIITSEHGVIVTSPGSGILSGHSFSQSTKIVDIKKGYVEFEKALRLKTRPMIGTIGVAPEGEAVMSGSLGRHGGNMDDKNVAPGSRLYLPVFTDGALWAAGDVHAVQADGELCVSAIEVSAQIKLRFDVVRGRTPKWPIVETRKSFAVLASGETLDKAAEEASTVAVDALMKGQRLSFEEAYMLASIAVDLEISQVVDPRKGVRAVIPKRFVKLHDLLS